MQSLVRVSFAPGTQWSQNPSESDPAACDARMYGKPMAAAEAAAVVPRKRRRVNVRRLMGLLLRSELRWQRNRTPISALKNTAVPCGGLAPSPQNYLDVALRWNLSHEGLLAEHRVRGRTIC